MAKKKTTAKKSKKSAVKKTTAKNTNALASALNTASSESKMSSGATTKMMSAKQLSITFVGWFIAHTLVFYLANRFFPEAVVLGTHQFSVWQSLLYSMLVLTLITVGFIPVVEAVANLQGRMLKAMDWMVVYFVINTAAIWTVARFAEQLGLGISSWLIAVALGLTLDVVQGLLVSKSGN